MSTYVHFVGLGDHRGVLLKTSTQEIWDTIAVGWEAAPTGTAAFAAEYLITPTQIGGTSGWSFEVVDDVGYEWALHVYAGTAPTVDAEPVSWFVPAARILEPTTALMDVTDGRTWRMPSRSGSVDSVASKNTLVLVEGEDAVLLAWDCALLMADGEYIATMTLPTLDVGLTGVTVESAAGDYGNDQRFAKVRLTVDAAAGAQTGYVETSVTTSLGTTLLLRGLLSILET